MTSAAGSTKQRRKSDQVRQVLLRSWRSSSDRKIAADIGVSNRTVSLHRKRLEEEGRILPRVNTHSSQTMVARGVYFGH